MIVHYPFSYLKCQSCSAKIHCEQCAAEAIDVMKAEGFTITEMNIPAKMMTVDIDPALENDLLDMLEEHGIFAD